MNGIATAAKASRKATLVWVKPAGLMMMAATCCFLGQLHPVDERALVIALEADHRRARRLALQRPGGD